MEFLIDRASDVPIRRQVRGTIEYAIACGELPVGAALPSVRELADRLGVAPMTISQAYADLKRDGLVEGRTGSGTYVADCAQAQVAQRFDADLLHREIDRLIDHAQARGIRLRDVAAMVNARLAYRAAVGRQASVFMAGLFAEATRSYARAIAEQLGKGATVQPVTLEALNTDEAMRAQVGAADLVVTFSTLRPALAAIFPNTRVIAIRFIPSETTRMELAAVDPLARVGVVSKFSDFLAVMRSGVQRFAAHVSDLRALSETDADLESALADRDVIVFSTGADAVLRRAPAGAKAIEYRHIPDPGDVDRVIRPLVHEVLADGQDNERGGLDVPAAGKEAS